MQAIEQETKQVTELSPLCASLIAMLEAMINADQVPYSRAAFNSTAVSAYSRLEEMRVAARLIPPGFRQDMAFELISHHSSVLYRHVQRFEQVRLRQEHEAQLDQVTDIRDVDYMHMYNLINRDRPYDNPNAFNVQVH